MRTVGYMSPEQVRGSETDHRSDIFSFGVMLHEMLAGARPFGGETAVDTMQAILRENAPDLPSTIPGGVRQVVSHCLEKDPAHRSQSARDLSLALRALAQDDSSSGAAHAMPSPPPAAPGFRMGKGERATARNRRHALITRELARAPGPTAWSAEQLGGPEVALHPRRSPDGRLLAFQAMVDGTAQVGLMDPESGNWNVLTSRRDLESSSICAGHPMQHDLLQPEWECADLPTPAPFMPANVARAIGPGIIGLALDVANTRRFSPPNMLCPTT